jgi:uncharacterized protein with NRDE domain
MCLIAWSFQPGAEQPLWIAANRDEHWDRPTLPLHVWTLPDGQTVLGGRDARAGGSWLAFAPGGRLAMLTNVRAWPPEAPAARSRGDLVLAWLARRASAHWRDFVQQHPAEAYNGCNLVLGDIQRQTFVWLSNRDPDAAEALPSAVERLDGWWAASLPPGVYGVSNAALQTPWPKLQALTAALTRALAADNAAEAERTLLDALRQHHPAPDEQTHLTQSPFVHLPARRYGTRSSLLARCRSDGWLEVSEWTYDSPAGPPSAWARAAQRHISIAWWGMPTSS